MSVNLLDLAKSSLTPILLSKAGSLFGLDEGIASKALGAVLPTLLSGVLSKSTTPQGADSLLNAIKDDSVDSNIVNNLSSLLGSESGVHGRLPAHSETGSPVMPGNSWSGRGVL